MCERSGYEDIWLWLYFTVDFSSTEKERHEWELNEISILNVIWFGIISMLSVLVLYKNNKNNIFFILQ